MIRSIFDFPRGDGVRHHLGTGRVAARAHARVGGQLRGTRIRHADRVAGAAGALRIAVIGAPLVARAVTLAGGALDVPTPSRAARRAVRLAAIAGAAQREHRAANAAEHEPVIVQEPAPDDALLAPLVAIGDGPLVREPA